MIFKGGYGRYFARTQVISGGLTFFKSVGWALVSSVMTLAAYYGILLLTRQNEDALPMCFHTSVFGLLYLYTVINTVVIFLVLLININFIRYPEITSNKWNLMTSMGISISKLVMSKVGASVLTLSRQYFIGYLFVIGCGILVKLPFSINYLLALFFAGCILLIFMCIVAQAMSVFTKWINAARIVMLFSFILTQMFMFYFRVYHKDMFQIEILIGWFDVESINMLTVFAVIFVLCYMIILFRAGKRTRQQELMPLSVFDIKPLLAGNAEELYTTEGLRNTTIFDVDELKEVPDYQAPAEKPMAPVQDESTERFRYGLLTGLSVFICLIGTLVLVITLFLPGMVFLLESVFGSSLSSSLMSSDGKIVTGSIAAIFLILSIIFAVLGKREKRRE